MEMKHNAVPAIRKLLAQTHMLHADTDLHVIEGSAPPQYAGGIGEGAVMTVGFLWLKENHPQAFVEVVTERLLPTA